MTSEEHYKLASTKADQYSLKLYRSTRKYNKYMFLNPETGKMTHFGRIGYDDYRVQDNLARRANYRKRHAGILNHEGKPAYKVKYSPSWASWTLLWT